MTSGRYSRAMTDLSRGARVRRGGRRPGWVLLTTLLVLAIGASSALVFTNRVELLKLAARAIGAVRIEEVEGEAWLNLHFADGSTMWSWNPKLHSDDAFDLMVTLNLSFQSYPSWDRAQAWHPMRPESAPEEPYVGDRRAAARLAVTRAAAEIGKAMA